MEENIYIYGDLELARKLAGKQIHKILIKKSVKKIFPGDFSGVANPFLNEFIVEEGHNLFSAVEGVLYNKEGTELIAFPPALKGEFVIPKSVRIIKKHSFDSSQLEKIVFNKELEIIEDYAFANTCFNKIDLSQTNVSDIKKSAFGGCNVENLFLPQEQPVKIHTEAFSFSGLIGLTISKNVESVGMWGFWNCHKLESVTIESTDTKFSGDSFCFCRNLKEIISPCERLTKKLWHGVRPSEQEIAKEKDSIMKFKDGWGKESIKDGFDEDHWIWLYGKEFTEQLKKKLKIK